MTDKRNYANSIFVATRKQWFKWHNVQTPCSQFGSRTGRLGHSEFPASHKRTSRPVRWPQPTTWVHFVCGEQLVILSVRPRYWQICVSNKASIIHSFHWGPIQNPCENRVRTLWDQKPVVFFFLKFSKTSTSCQNNFRLVAYTACKWPSTMPSFAQLIFYKL